MRVSKLKMGQRIYWDDLLDPRRGTFKIRTAVVVSTKGRNIETEDTWLYGPDLKNLRLEKQSPW